MASKTVQGADSTRREFFKTTGATVVGATVLGATQVARAASTDVLKVGLIGCGGRGSGAAREALMADENTVLFAMGDAFADHLDTSYSKFKGSDLDARLKVDDAHKFVGFDAYQKVIDSCDVIVLATPPAFRPEHLKYAVEQGKHIFCEKPIAVDPVGVRSVMETCELAKKKNLSLVSGLCYRYQFAKQAVIGKIHQGGVGDIISMQTTYNTGSLWYREPTKDWTEMDVQMRNWLYFDWLSGDHINEQHIHSLDKILWVMGDVAPKKVTSSGGRSQRTDEKFGNVYDHFNSVYEWDNGVRCFSSCRQWESTSTDVSDWINGTEGVAELQSATVTSRGGDTWKHKQDGPDNMYLNEHVALFDSIRNGKAINNGDYMCKSTMMAIMARMSAYTGKTVTWKQAMESELDLTPKKLAWGDNAVNPIARPGETKCI